MLVSLGGVDLFSPRPRSPLLLALRSVFSFFLLSLISQIFLSVTEEVSLLRRNLTDVKVYALATFTIRSASATKVGGRGSLALSPTMLHG